MAMPWPLTSMSRALVPGRNSPMKTFSKLMNALPSGRVGPATLSILSCTLSRRYCDFSFRESIGRLRISLGRGAVLATDTAVRWVGAETRVAGGFAIGCGRGEGCCATRGRLGSGVFGRTPVVGGSFVAAATTGNPSLGVGGDGGVETAVSPTRGSEGGGVALLGSEVFGATAASGEVGGGAV